MQAIATVVRHRSLPRRCVICEGAEHESRGVLTSKPSGYCRPPVSTRPDQLPHGRDQDFCVETMGQRVRERPHQANPTLTRSPILRGYHGGYHEMASQFSVDG